MADYLSEQLKKLALLGVGAVATATEKTKEVVDELIKKGEITVEQGKALNEELHRKASAAAAAFKDEPKSVADELDKLSPEELNALRAKLAELDKKAESGDGSAED